MDINPLRFGDFAKIAATEFIERNVPLNTTISKLAEKNNLSPHQIQRVVEMANLETNDRLFKTAKDKTFTFPIASLEGVQGELNPPSRMVKTSSVLNTLFPSTKEKSHELGVSIEKTAEKARARDMQPILEKRATIAAESLVAEAKKRTNELLLREMSLAKEAEAVYEKIRSDVKNFVVLEGGKLNDLLKFACIARPDGAEFWKGMFESIKNDLIKLGHPVDKALIDQNLEMPGAPVEVINGGHSMLIDLDTFRKKVGEIDRYEKGMTAVADAANPVPEKVRVFKDSEDTDYYLLEEIENLAKKASIMGDLEFLDGFKETMTKCAGKTWAGRMWRGSFKAMGRHPVLTLLGAAGGLYAVPKALQWGGQQLAKTFQREARPEFSYDRPEHLGYAGM